jgi:predicted DNA binding CopG/RHH family protein
MSYVRMLPAEIEALKKHAKRQKLTYSELVRLILQKYLREQEVLTHGEKALD